MVLEEVPAARLEALAEAAEAYVFDAFGQRLELAPVAPTNLPHFVTDRYRMWQGSLNGRTLLLIAIRDMRPGQGVTADYLKHRDLVHRTLDVDIVLLLLDHAPNAIRRQMMDRKIGFIAAGAQLYVPEAFLDLRERAPAFAVAHADDAVQTQAAAVGREAELRLPDRVDAARHLPVLAEVGQQTE